MSRSCHWLASVVVLLSIVFAGASAALLRFSIWGPFRLALPVNSPVNAESVVAVSFVLILLLMAWLAKSSPSSERKPACFLLSDRIAAAAIIGTASLSYAASLRAPLLFDSYTHLALASRESFKEALGTFYQHPAMGDFFFRPLGELSYWIDFHWAAFDPLRWNLWNLVVHVLTCLLVYILARQLRQSPIVAMVSALIFALHGSRPEVVSWVAARFDLLATFFVVLSLVALQRYWAAGNRLWLGLSVCALLAALLSKESAYCLPLLLICLLAFEERSKTRQILRAAGMFALIAAGMFAYRYWVLNGIGGYKEDLGGATILRFSALRTVRALLFREWAFLFFPINWSSGPRTEIQVGAVLVLAVLCGFLLWVRPNARRLVGCLCLVVAASLPVQHLLLLGPDMSGARVLYLPVLGVSLLWGSLLERCGRRSHFIMLAAALLASQVVMLEHNLAIWNEVAHLSQQTCRAFGQTLETEGGRASVVGLPAVWNGVYFLRNGFAECVAINSNVKADRIDLARDPARVPADRRVFVWLNTQGLIEEKKANASPPPTIPEE